MLEDLNIAGTFFCCAYNNNLDDLIIRKCDRDIAGENGLEEAERKFVEYLQKGVEPPLLPIEGERAVNRFLSTHPIANDTTFSLPEALKDIIKQYMDLSEEKSIFEKSARQIGKELDTLKVTIMENMGDNALGEIAIGNTTYVVDMSNKTPRRSINNKNYELLVEKYPDAAEFISEGVTRKFSISEKKVKD